MRKIPQPIALVKATSLFALACLLHVRADELSLALGPLWNPDLPSAKQAVANLTKLAASQSGAAKSQSEHLAQLLKNLFTAEYQLAEASKASAQAEEVARQKIRNSDEWMIPNIWGRVNQEASQQALAEAAAIRSKAARRIADAQQNLVAQLRETDSLIEDFHQLDELEVVLVLVDTSAALAERSLTKEQFTSAFPPDTVAKVRETLRLREAEKTKLQRRGAK